MDAGLVRPRTGSPTISSPREIPLLSTASLSPSPPLSDSSVGGSSDLEHECEDLTSGRSSFSETYPASLPESIFDHSTFDAGSFDDLTRDVRVIRPGDHERIYHAQMLADSGNPHVSLISSKFADRLCLPRSHPKPSSAKRAVMLVLRWLAPWTRAGMAAKKRAGDQVRSIDGAKIRGQDGFVKVEWYGKNPGHLRHKIIYFQPKRYETTFLVVDTNDLAADMILCWPEVKRLGLQKKFTAGIRPPPTPAPRISEAEYRCYEQRKTANDKARSESRKAAQGQPPKSSKENEAKR